jgi:hypothetical protein
VFALEFVMTAINLSIPEFQDFFVTVVLGKLLALA